MEPHHDEGEELQDQLVFEATVQSNEATPEVKTEAQEVVSGPMRYLVIHSGLNRHYVPVTCPFKMWLESVEGVIVPSKVEDFGTN